MRRVEESELESEFERQFAWGDDERHYYNPNRRKASVMNYFLRLETVIEQIRKHAPGKRIADLASAQGTFSLLLAEDGFEVTAVDLKPEFLNYARKKHTHGRFETRIANIIEFRGEQPFDCVLLGEVIEHVARPDQLLRSAWLNLRSGGLLVLTTPNGNEYGQGLPTYKQVEDFEALIPKQFHWGDHLFLYTEEELRELLNEQGFDVLEIHKLNSSYVTQLKGVRYLMPLRFLRWLERVSRNWKKKGKDSTSCLVVSARKKKE